MSSPPSLLPGGDEGCFNSRRTDSSLLIQNYHADIESPNDMQVDTSDYLNDAEGEKDDGDVAIINTDDGPRADDFEAMKEIVFTPLPEQPPTLEIQTHTWSITNWRELPRRAHGPVFQAGGHPWRILMFPTGNNVEYASFYLEHGYEDAIPDDFACCVQFSLVLWNPEAPQCYQSHTAHHRFTKEEGDWGFTRFVELRKLWQQPWDESGSYLAGGQRANMTAYVKIVEDETGVLWHNFNNYDSKKETGFVGLKNQGATCYLNSLIQSLYFTNAFRKAVYQIPTEHEINDSDPKNAPLMNSAYTLQRLFYFLQSSTMPVSTLELTKSFGWETRHIFEQQDVQELSRKLMEKMEEKMKGSEAENVLPRLFCGKVRTYISCINVEYESRRLEDFWDVQLNVRGNKDILASFNDYIEVEIMNGDNQYFAGDEFKLQDAKKGVIFESFPEVLHLQLKRFEYDVEHDAMMKVNDRYEFPETFDASPFLANDADISEPWVYQLHGVLVHAGDLNAGHYYAFIKPTKDGWFYKYDDDRVTKATLREVMEDNYGGEYPASGLSPKAKTKPVLRHNSAYMLVYIRQSRVEKVLPPVTDQDVPSHLKKKLDEEAAQREARKKEREEAHLYMGIRVITDDTYRAHSGVDLTLFERSHNDDPAAARFYRYLRKATLTDLANTIARDTEVDARRIRFWGMVNRQNKTVRPDVPFADMNMTVEEAHQRMAGSKGTDMRLWAELADNLDGEGEPIWPSSPGTQNGSPKNDLIVLFLKEFNAEQQKLNGAGHIYISREKKVEDLVPAILKKMNWPEKHENGQRVQLKLFEEIKPTMVEAMKAKQSLKAAELQDGDIVCFQLAYDLKSDSELSVGALSQMFPLADLDRGQSIKSERSLSVKSDDQSVLLTANPIGASNTGSSMGSGRTPSVVSERASLPKSNPDQRDDAKAYYDFLLYKREITFHHKKPPKSTGPDIAPFSLALSSKHSYDHVAYKVGERLNIDPTHLRFWTYNAGNHTAKHAVKRSPNLTLHSILHPPYSAFSNTNQRPDALFFEILDMSLSELDTKQAVKVTWVSDGISKSEKFELLVPKNGTVEDLVASLIKKAELDDEVKGGPIRIYETHSNKIHKELSRESTIQSISSYSELVAERIPEDDLIEQDSSEFIPAFHFQSEPSKSHGIPFRFRLIPKEPFSETKKRLEKRTGFKGKNFEKIKFAVVKRSTYSKPQYLSDDQILDEVVTSEDDLLGLDHVDRSRAVRNGAQDLFLK
ncbi:unnamed protein product [Diplocarpon coronariae]|nr:ubiquitin carboxyl-terminal hydrolase [Diplocarpon mali]